MIRSFITVRQASTCVCESGRRDEKTHVAQRHCAAPSADLPEHDDVDELELVFCALPLLFAFRLPCFFSLIHG